MPPRSRLPWPVPALLAWGSAWALFLLLRGLDAQGAALAAVAASLVLAWAWPGGVSRKLLIGAGFPLSLLMAGPAAAMPSMLWLLALALLALLYPLQAWRDAPFFPTPRDALHGLLQATGLSSRARLLDAGCGLGHGLQALRRACPEASIEGVERSRPLRWAALWRCRFACVRQGDMWQLPWQGYDLVYLFQRPESMPRAWLKASAEMSAGAWLASLEFAVPDRSADAVLHNVDGKPVWLYRLGAAGGAQSTAATADNLCGMPARPQVCP